VRRALALIVAGVLLLVLSSCGQPGQKVQAVVVNPSTTTAAPSTATTTFIGEAVATRPAVRLGVPSTVTIVTTTLAAAPLPVRGDCGTVEAALERIDRELVDVGVQLAKRESHCCPNALGGDILGPNCEVVGIESWSHRGDAGLFQLNHVWHDPSGPLCDSELRLCGAASIIALTVDQQVAVFVHVYRTFGGCHWKKPRYCS
jgi:hypothetical protein